MVKSSITDSSVILLVDDDFRNLQLLGGVLKNNGYKTEFAVNAKAALEWLEKRDFSLILLDVTMPEMDGFEACEKIRAGEKNADVPIIFLSGKTDKQDILKGFKIGGQDYVTKPFDEEILLARVRTHLMLFSMQKKMEGLVSKRTYELEVSQLELKKSLLELELLKEKLHDENQYMQEEIKLNNNFEEIIGESKSLKKTLLAVQQVAKTNSTVLIKGETGTGKELVARSINNLSTRNNQPLIKLNCAALPESLIESELFGHEKGAFTSAINARKGKFELADKGTLFLDEIGELPLSLQPKLLRVLQEGEFERVGGNKTFKVDVRLISATNRNLETMVNEGKFRSDLFYRLNIFPIEIEPLRNRVSDISLLVNFFVQKHGKKLNRPNLIIDKQQISMLEEYSWPGNVRELENVIERAIISSNGKTLNFDTSFFLNNAENLIKQPLHVMEREYILDVLKAVDWVISGDNGAAAILKLHPNTLRSKMEKLGIKKNVSFE